MDVVSGDIIQTTSNGYIPFATHYAILFDKDGVLYAAHVPGGKGVAIEPYSEFIKCRRLIRIAAKSNMNDVEIYSKALSLQATRTWDLLTFSCEDFVREFCDNCYLGINQRIWGLFASLLLLTGIFLVIRYIVKH